MRVVRRAKSKIPYLNLHERAGPRQSQNFLSRFHHSSSFHSNDSLAQNCIFCGVRRECGLQREDQQDDDEDRTGEESDGGPLAAV